MTYHAAIVIRFPGDISLDERDDLIETVRQYALPIVSDRNLLIEWEAESQWDLRGLVENTIYEVEANFARDGLFPDREVYEVARRRADDTDLGKWAVWATA
jgi:hypothetical protein